MKKLKSNGYKGGNVVTSSKPKKDLKEENIQNDLKNFLSLIQNKFINSELNKNDIELYIQCLNEISDTGTSSTFSTSNFNLNYLIPFIQNSLDSGNHSLKHLNQQIEYFEDMLNKVKQKPIPKQRTKPTQGKVIKDPYKEGNIGKKVSTYKISNHEKIKEDINIFLKKVKDSYLNNIYSKKDLECYIDCLNHLKSSTHINHYPENKSLCKIAKFTQKIFENNEIQNSDLDYQIQGIINILVKTSPLPIIPKRTKPTKGKINTLSKGYKK